MLRVCLQAMAWFGQQKVTTMVSVSFTTMVSVA